MIVECSQSEVSPQRLAGRPYSYSDTTALVVSARYICILVHELFTAAVRVF